MIFEGGLVILWLALGRLLDLPTTGQLRLTGGALLLGTAATIPLLPALHWCTRSQFGPLQRLTREVEEVLVPLLSRLTVADFGLVALLAGLGEEGLFRGIIQNSLTGAVSPAAALLISSGLFGLLHMITPAYAVLAGLLGLYLGGLYFATGNLAVPVAVHALYDFFALVYLVKWRGGQR